MKHNVRFISIALCTSLVMSCAAFNPHGYTNYQTYTYDDAPLYPESYYDSTSTYKPKKQVSVPESYHVGSYHSPVSHEDRDRSWVARQSSQGYTIELGEGTKASEVAGKLYKAPKNDRMAQIKYQRGAQIYYKGVYGSYPSYDEAQQALRGLPDDIKQGAKIQSWSSVQSNTQ